MDPSSTLRLKKTILGILGKIEIEENSGNVLDDLGLEVSKLMNTQYHRFSEARLTVPLNKLDRKVTEQVSRHRKNEPLQEFVMT